MKTKLAIIAICALYAGCASAPNGQSPLASLQSTKAKVIAFNHSPDGIATLTAVADTASTFEPQYAGVIGLGLDSLIGSTPPSEKTLATTLASVTGKSASDSKVVALTGAVLQVLQKVPAPVALNAAANTISK